MRSVSNLSHGFDLKLTPTPRPTSLVPQYHRSLWFHRRTTPSKSVLLTVKCFSGSELKTDDDGGGGGGKPLLKSVTSGFLGFAATAVALASVWSDSPAVAESLTVAFPASRVHEVKNLIFHSS